MNVYSTRVSILYNPRLNCILVFIAANKRKLICFKTAMVYCTEVAVSWLSGVNFYQDKMVETD